MIDVAKRVEIVAAKRRRKIAEAARVDAVRERSQLSAGALRGDVLAAWAPVEKAVVDVIAEINKELISTGGKLAVMTEERPGQIAKVLQIRFQDNLPGAGASTPLTISVIANPERDQIAYSGPSGKVLNGDSGHMNLYDGNPAAQLADQVMRYVEECA